MKITTISVILCFCMICPTFGSLVSASEIVIDSNNALINNTSISRVIDNIEYNYAPNGTLLSTIPIQSAEEQKQSAEREQKEYQALIESKLNESPEYLPYYYRLINSHISYGLIYESLNKIESLVLNKTFHHSNETKTQLDVQVNRSLIGSVKQDTYGFSPQTRGSIWNEVLHDDFTYGALTEWTPWVYGNGMAYATSGYLKLDSRQGGAAYVDSYPLDIYTENTPYSNIYYSISLRFRVDDTAYMHNH